MPTLNVFWKRALVLSALGVLNGGDLLAQSSMGLLQTPRISELPVSIQPTGSIPIRDFIIAARYEHTAEIVLLLTSETYAEFKKAEPVRIEAFAEYPETGIFTSDGRFLLMSDTEAQKLVAEDEDIEILLLFAAHISMEDEE